MDLLRHLILFWSVIIYCECCIQIFLDSNQWQLRNSNNSINISATVPGGVYSDLHNAGILKEDIFYRFNDEEYRWVGKDNWTYSTNFDVDSSVFKKKHIFLAFYGLDTIADVYINNIHIGNTENMFVMYRFDISGIIQSKNNALEVQFTSPILEALERSRKSPYEVPPKCVEPEYRGECHINYLRKMQASFAWDWGPAFPSMGIWKHVSLEAYNNVLARYMGVKTEDKNDKWVLSATLYADLSEKVNGTIVATLWANNDTVIKFCKNVIMIPDKDGQGNATLSVTISKSLVDTWWPNGYGDQPLYLLKMNFTKPDENSAVEVRVGFRTVKLIQEVVDKEKPEIGLRFYFEVNGIPIFAKGSNFIPSHILPELSYNITSVKNLLTSAKDANMNMLRVWGGGLYESDIFYWLCDEMGILIWQDMAFACSMYPAFDNFLASVRVEVKQQVRRIQHHACIAVWAGNNENEAALRDNWYQTANNFSLYKSDYIKLYVNTVRQAIVENDDTRSVVISSPSNGLKSEEEDYVAENPYSTLYGDVHFYSYFYNLWKPDKLPRSRFASEYGIQSLPSIESFTSIALPNDLSIGSQFLRHRQHHAGGYLQMLIQIAQNLPSIKSSDLETFIYLSQINQAMAMKTETETYRRMRNTLYPNGEGMTMGALYWQLNDVWQAPTWSSIEFNGKWKILHYFAKNFFSSVLVSPSLDSEGLLTVSLISDLLIDMDIQVQINIYRWDSLTPVYKTHISSKMAGSYVTEIVKTKLNTLLSKSHKCGSLEMTATKKCFLWFTIKSANKNKIALGPDNFLFPQPLHSVVGLKNATVTVKKVTSDKNLKTFKITLESDAIALFVLLDVKNMRGHFSDNGFLIVTRKKTVTFHSEDSIPPSELKTRITIKSLGNIVHNL